MIELHTGLQAYVATYKENEGHATDLCYEYTAPLNSPFFSTDANLRYIEAVDDEQFELVLIIPSSFHFGTMTHVQVTYSINGSTVLVDQLVKPTTPARLESRCVAVYTEVGDTLQRAAIKFPHLCGPTESDTSSSHTGQALLADCGKIEIVVQLGKGSDLDKGIKVFPVHSTPQEGPRKVAVDIGTSSSAATKQGDATLPPSWKGWEWSSSLAKFARVKFTFCYASRRFLAIKKVVPVPRAASKLPDPTNNKPDSHVPRKAVNKKIETDEDDEEPSLPVKKETQSDITKGKKRESRDQVEDENIVSSAPKKIKYSTKKKAQPVEDRPPLVKADLSKKKSKTDAADQIPNTNKAQMESTTRSNGKAVQLAELQKQLNEMQRMLGRLAGD